ncbi:MAG: cyclic nucleotide-binding domain-containing protein [Gemmatimonadota bacterium]|jgi:serine phosphatase RsbU (regulator of sigma subunit)
MDEPEDLTDTDQLAARIVDLLGTVRLFQGLARRDLERIAALARPRELDANEVLFREGDAGDRFYVVFSGAVEVLKERPLGDHERLAIRRAGDAFGEMSLLNDAPRSASVRALEPSRLLAISREDFDSLLGGESLSVRLMRGLAKALRTLDVRFARGDTTASPGDAIGEFSRLVHHGLLPRHPPVVEDWEIAGGSVLDEDVIGTSYWDGFVVAGGTALLTVMDVKGSGLPPAYLLGITRGVLRTLGGEEREFDDLLTRLNHAAHENLFEGVDECVECGVLRVSRSGLSWSGAGDQPATVIRADGTVEQLKTHGPPLAILPRFEYGTTLLELNSGDIVLVASEANAGIMRGAIDLIKAHREAGLDAIAGALRTALLKAAESQGRHEDLAFVLVRKV